MKHQTHGPSLDCFTTLIYAQQTQQTPLLLIMDQIENKLRTSIKLKTLVAFSNYSSKNMLWNQREKMGFSLTYT